jgi:hypothetical protein
MITSMRLLVVSSDKKKVKHFLTFFLSLVTCVTYLSFLVNCASIENHQERVPAVYHQPKYLSSYWIQAQNFPVEGINDINGINWHQPYVFLPPLRLDEKGQVSENYSLSLAKNENNRDHLGAIYNYSSDFTLSAKSFSGFIDALVSFFGKTVTKLYIYEMPENLDQAIMVKYYYTIDDSNILKASNEVYRIVLIISIEWMQIDGEKIQLETVWRGEMGLSLSRSIDWMEAINLGYHKLSQYVLRDGSIKDRINLLNF